MGAAAVAVVFYPVKFLIIGVLAFNIIGMVVLSKGKVAKIVGVLVLETGGSGDSLIGPSTVALGVSTSD